MSNNMRIHKQIATWLKKQIMVQGKRGACVRVVLHHVGTSGKLGPEIETVVIGDGKPPGDTEINPDDIEQYAGTLESSASDYAEGMGMTQTFALASYFEEDERHAYGRLPFRINVDTAEEEGEVSSEPANLEGMTKQQMRHNEALMRMTISAFGSILHTQQKQNEQLATMVTEMHDARIEQIEAVEALVSAKHQREIELAREEQGAKHKAQILDNVLALIPAVGNRLAGKHILPETTDTLQLQVIKLVEAMTQPEFDKVIGAIDDPIKKIALVELFRMVQERVSASNGANDTGKAS